MTIIDKIARRMRHAAFGIAHRNGRDIEQVKLAGFDLVVRVNEDVGRDIALGSFERAETDFFSAQIREDDCCFDVGGNVGYFAMLMASRARRGRVDVFEPIPLNAAFVRFNAALNGFDHVAVTQTAVSNVEGHTRFSVASDSAYSSIMPTGTKQEVQSIDVPLTTLDAYIAAKTVERVDILKVDVEGAEHLVVEGAVGLLSDRSRRPRLVLLELFDKNLRPFGTSVASVIARMETLSYHPHVLDRGVLRIYDAAKDAGFYNVIFTPAS